MLIQSYPLGAIGTNCYLFCEEQTKTCAIVDPGAEGARVLAALHKLGWTPEYILLTHGHFDHTQGVPALRASLPQVPVYLHPADSADAPPYYPTAQLGALRAYGEGDTLPLGGLTIHVLHTPGHTPGSVTLQVEDALFTGDTLFRGSMGRTDLPGGSYGEIMRSLQRLGRLDGDYRVFPGHEGTSTLEAERAGNYYLREAMAQ